MHSGQRGYTLYELLITTLLVVLLSAIAIPSLSAGLARQRQRAEIDALFHAVHLARKESIMRRKVVSICPSDDAATCGEDAQWSSGWLMFENTDRDSPPRVDYGEALLQHHVVDPETRIHANRRGFTLRATFLRATNGTIIVCDSRRRIPAKALVVSFTGRPRVASHKTNGEPYSCPNQAE
ncbi:MAG: GspH/FimT family pseudopilin [Gammaproteobacteria bacterium]|nr:GspH/FimT family pseudopilin [Gammaproteobacteria bacterium]